MRIFSNLFSPTPLVDESSTRGPASAPSAGGELLDALDQRTRGFDRRLGQLRTEDPAALEVNLDAHIDPDGPDGLGGGRLDASRVAAGAMLMAAPKDVPQADAFVQECVKRDIGHVIDLTGGNAVTGDSAAKMKSWTGRGGSVQFRPSHDGNWKMASSLGDGANEYRVLAQTGREQQTIARELSWTRIPMETGRQISPDTLLAACRQIAANANLDDRSLTSFMDDNGGNTAATFAAANAIFRSHQRQPLTAQSANDEVVKACALLRSRRAPTLFTGRPDLLDTLSKFTRQLVEEGAWNGAAGPSKEAPRPSLPDTSGFGEPAPTMSDAKRRFLEQAQQAFSEALEEDRAQDGESR